MTLISSPYHKKFWEGTLGSVMGLWVLCQKMKSSDNSNIILILDKSSYQQIVFVLNFNSNKGKKAESKVLSVFLPLLAAKINGHRIIVKRYYRTIQRKRKARAALFFEKLVVMWYGHSGASMQSDIIIWKTFSSIFRFIVLWDGKGMYLGLIGWEWQIGIEWFWYLMNKM